MQAVKILNSQMAYTQAGNGERAVVFLHGNPTSSYLWRNVIPHVADQARCLAPDLIGMGASGKPDIAYRSADHARYLDAFLDTLDLDQMVLVGHDWGGALGLDWAARHPQRARGVALLETFLRPMTWAEYPSPADELFRMLRTPGVGEQMVLEENWFIQTALRATNPGITDDDLAVYRAPYPDPASRRPLLLWPREIPLDGEPADVRDRFLAYDQWLAATPEVPKLLLTTQPGSLVSPAIVQWAREHVAGLEIESVGPAITPPRTSRTPSASRSPGGWPPPADRRVIDRLSPEQRAYNRLQAGLHARWSSRPSPIWPTPGRCAAGAGCRTASGTSTAPPPCSSASAAGGIESPHDRASPRP